MFIRIPEGLERGVDTIKLKIETIMTSFWGDSFNPETSGITTMSVQSINKLNAKHRMLHTRIQIFQIQNIIDAIWGLRT